MTKYVECWGADRPFANIAESKLVKNIGLAVSVGGSWLKAIVFPAAKGQAEAAAAARNNIKIKLN